MSSDRGTGAFLKKRLGGGKEVYCYGGSFSLAEASVRNSRLDRKHRGNTQHIEEELGKHLRSNIREVHSLKEELQKLEQERKSFDHYERKDEPPLGHVYSPLDPPHTPGGGTTVWSKATRRKRSLSVPQTTRDRQHLTSDREVHMSKSSGEDVDFLAEPSVPGTTNNKLDNNP